MSRRQLRVTAFFYLSLVPLFGPWMVYLFLNGKPAWGLLELGVSVVAMIVGLWCLRLARRRRDREIVERSTDRRLAERRHRMKIALPLLIVAGLISLLVRDMIFAVGCAVIVVMWIVSLLKEWPGAS